MAFALVALVSRDLSALDVSDMRCIPKEFVNAMSHGREQIAVSTRVNAPQHVIDV